MAANDAIPGRSRVPLNDLGRFDDVERAEIDAAVSRVLDSGWYVMGPEHDAFERELAAYAGAAAAVALGNGTDALELGLAALGIGRGDRVLTVANAGAYATTAARLLGATPVYADVDERSLLLTPATLETALARLDALGTPPKALVVTHLFGSVVAMPSILAIARERGMRVIEDCAQAFGAVIDGARVGTFGDLGTLSFYPTKNLGALGDGGAILTSDPEVADTVRRLRQYGWTSKYRIGAEHGRNSRLDELQAAILRSRLPRLDAANDRRRAIHARYEAATTAMVTTVAGPYIGHLAVAAFDDRDAARARFADAGITTDVHYPVPDHQQAFPVVRAEAVSLPVTERAAARILSVPIFPGLTDDEIERVCAVLAEVDA
ncbi:MAG TPA: DegT/DnrJ/EryC1/StrS family aminotransferase [Microbacteriaceae bacterium]|nr:DegT/DnrJ/EryC1/StrS family aminotransferase [Microbacteriaceae bacterium]